MAENYESNPEQKQGLEMEGKPFGELDALQRVLAVIATIQEPLDRELILNFAGVDAEDLDDDQKAEIEEIFRSTKIEGEAEESPLYWVTPDRKEEVYQELGVDPKSVNGHIADVMMKDFFGAEDDLTSK